MKQSSFIKNLVWLRVCIMLFLLAIASLFLLSFTVTNHVGEELWKQLGLTQQQGNDKIKNSFINDYFDTYGLRTAKNIATGNRAAIAKDLLTYVKQYVNSPSFKTVYEKERNYAKPNVPVPNSKTKESIRKDKIEETKKLMKTTEEIIKTSKDDMKKTMQNILDMHKKNLADYQDPNSKFIDMLWKQELSTRESDMKHYEENLKRWETNYPANHKEVVKMRLQRYLTVAATVDFGAELVTGTDKKKRFVNRTYESKNYEWKMIYRAGKEVYDVAKVFAENWQKEL
jgi:hypothetical protein